MTPTPAALTGDQDRRHLFAVPVDRPQPVELTAGDGIELKSEDAGDGEVAFVAAGYGEPARVKRVSLAGPHAVMPIEAPSGYPADKLVAPNAVSWTAPDGLVIHGQLFQRADGAPVKPGLIFVHGGPERQMLLGWHYMDYYSNAYAVNQFLAAHGYVVLSVNYRLGIGYGRAYQHPDHAGPAGAAEYQDVLSGARYLQGLKGVDPARIGIWGGSYGGLLTAMALARNSDVFKAGVDLHGVHDWTQDLARAIGKGDDRYEQGDREAFMKMAWQSSPDAYISTWTSPVLLIQGDDDRNVAFHQTVDLVRRLKVKGDVPMEEMVLADEIHGFPALRQAGCVGRHGDGGVPRPVAPPGWPLSTQANSASQPEAESRASTASRAAPVRPAWDWRSHCTHLAWYGNGRLGPRLAVDLGIDAARALGHGGGVGQL